MTPMKYSIALSRKRAAPPARRPAWHPIALALVGLIFVITACGSPSAGMNPSLDPVDADVTVIARDMAFDQETITIPAGSPWSLLLVNEEAAPHNVAIYTDESARESVFVGDLISSTTVVYQVPAIEPGAYFFRCDLHPEMNGTILVED
jgi:plastocyanin